MFLSRKAYQWMSQFYQVIEVKDKSKKQSEVTPPVLEPLQKGIGTKTTVVVGDNPTENWSSRSDRQLTLFDLWDMKESHQDYLDS